MVSPKSPVEAENIDAVCVFAAFVSAAGYASAAVLYNFSDPSFIYDVYTLPPFEVDIQLMHCDLHR